jgi:hypothetical protein
MNHTYMVSSDRDRDAWFLLVCSTLSMRHLGRR